MDKLFGVSVAEAMRQHKASDKTLWEKETRFHPELPNKEETGGSGFAFFLSKNRLKLHTFVSCNFARSSGSTFASLKMLKILRCVKKLKGSFLALTRIRAAAAAASPTTNGKRLMIRRRMLRKMKSPRRKKKRRLRWGYIGYLNPKLFLFEGMFYKIKIIIFSAQGKKNKKEKKQKKTEEKADLTPEEEKDKLEKEGKKQLMKDAKKAGKL